MEPDGIAATIRAAEGYAFLGIVDEAWDLLESLPPDVRVSSAVFAVRLVVCTAKRAWPLGIELARMIRPEMPLAQREAAGRFHLARAVDYCREGLPAVAKEAVRLMAAVWPEGREEALRTRGLDPLWERDAL